MITTKKYMLKFTTNNFQEPISYALTKRFNIVPNIMQAKVNESGGGLILDLQGEESDIEDAKQYMEGLGILVKELEKHVNRDETRCIHCGACVSVCPVKAFVVSKLTWEVEFKGDLCIACESCLTACSSRAMKIELW